MSAVMFAPAVRGRTALLSAVAMMALSLAGPLAAAELRVSAVVLSSAGVAQFTHSGAVKPGDRIDIPVRLDQVDDLLIGRTGDVRAVVVGVGDKNVALPFASLTIKRMQGSNAIDKIVVSYSKQQLQQAPRFAFNGEPQTTGSGGALTAPVTPAH